MHKTQCICRDNWRQGFAIPMMDKRPPALHPAASHLAQSLAVPFFRKSPSLT